MEKAVVFGCGVTARKSRDRIRERFEVIAYTCNDSSQWGGQIDGVTIIDPKRIPEDAAVVVASQDYYPEIIYGLEKQGRKGDVYTIFQEDFVRYFMPDEQSDRGIFERPEQEVVPEILQVDISNLCNSRCRYCPFQSEYAEYNLARGFMNEAVLERTISQIQHITTLKELQFVGNGEPMTHPHWNEYAARILNANSSFEKFIMYTNGMLLTEENAERLKNLPVQKIFLVLSIDGMSPEDCEYWRKGEKFSVIRKNVNRAYDILSNRDGEIDFLVSGCTVLPASVDIGTPAEVADFLARAQEWRKKEFPFVEHSNGLALSYTGPIPGTKVVAVPTYPHVSTCNNLFKRISILSNGGIVSCPCGSMSKNKDVYFIGDIMKDDLLDVFYNSEILAQVRNDFLSSNRPAFCGDCCQLYESKILGLQRTERDM